MFTNLCFLANQVKSLQRFNNVAIFLNFSFRIQKVYDILKEQSEILKEIRLRTQEKIKKDEVAKQEQNVLSKSLLGMTEKLSLF